MVRQSIQKKLTRVRPPSLQTSYDLQVGAAIELSELPFVVGLIGDLKSQSAASSSQVTGCRFVDVNSDNFDSVLQSMKSAIALSAEDRVLDSGDLPVSLDGQGLGDFEPEQSEQQMRPLRELLDLKSKLSDLNGTLPSHEQSDQVATEAALNGDKLDKLQAAMAKDNSAIEDDSGNQNGE